MSSPGCCYFFKAAVEVSGHVQVVTRCSSLRRAEKEKLFNAFIQLGDSVPLPYGSSWHIISSVSSWWARLLGLYNVKREFSDNLDEEQPEVFD